MNGIEAFWGVLFWAALVLGVLFLGPLQTRHAPGRLTQMVTWVLMTALTFAYGGLLVFVIVHVMLFTWGTGAAAFGLLASAVLMTVTPLAWWFGIRAVARRIDPRGRARS
jgi:hypothetical protein